MANQLQQVLNRILQNKKSNLTPLNLREGVRCLGIDGNLEDVVEATADATASSHTILAGETAYVDGQKVEGTMPNLGELVFSPSDEEHTTTSGYTEGIKVEAADITKLEEYKACLELAESVDTEKDFSDATAVAEDIREGKIAYARGERLVGAMPDANALIDGKGTTQQFMISLALERLYSLNIPDECTNFSSAFSSCRKLTSIPDITVPSIINARYMFSSCYNLTSIPNMNMENIQDAYCMFNECHSITTLPNCNFNSAINVMNMFYNCTSLESVDLYFPKVSNISNTFRNCTNLKTVNFTLTRAHSISNMYYAFANCTNLEGITLNTVNLNNNITYAFQNCKNLKEVNLTQTSGNVFYISTDYMFDGCEGLETYPNIPTSYSGTSYGTFRNCKGFKTLPHIKVYGVCANMFEGCENLETIETLEFTKSISAETQNRAIFKDCKKLKNVKLKFTGKIFALNYVFEGCSSLTEIPPEMMEYDQLAGWNSTFKDCTSLTFIPANIWDVRAAVGAIGAVSCFSGCTNLKDVGQFKFNVSNGDAQYVTNVFANCPNLTDESLNNIMGGFATTTWQKGTRTLRNIGFTSEQAAKCTAMSNWALLQAQGWGTGY